MKLSSLPYALFLSSILVFFGCTSTQDSTSMESIPNYAGRQSLLTNYADNFIIPSYQKLESNILTLEEKFKSFKANQNEESLISLQNQFIETYVAWQNVSPYSSDDKIGIGPAFTFQLTKHLNSYPTDLTSLNIEIKKASFDLEKNGSERWKGLPALDYLLFQSREKDITKIIASFTTDEMAVNRMTLTEKIIIDMKQRVSHVKNEWEKNYKEEFIKNNGTAKGSSLSNLANSFTYELEEIKNTKVGIPAGFKSEINRTYPTKCEAYYSNQSFLMISTKLAALENLFIGGENNSFRTNLDELEVKGNDQGLLSELILKQFSTVRTSLDKFEKPLSQEIEDKNQNLQPLYDELHMSVVYVKNQMVSGLGAAINYQDNDGD